MCVHVCACGPTLDVGSGRGGTVVLEVIQDAGVPGETQQDLKKEESLREDEETNHCQTPAV